MYADPALIRKHTSKLYLNDPEQQLIDALVRYTGEERGALLRSLVMEGAVKALHGLESAGGGHAMRGAQAARFGT